MGLRDLLRGRDDARAPDVTLTASAAVINLSDRSEAGRLQSKATAQTWHPDAWVYHRAIGEVRYGHRWLGTAVSRMRLYLAVIHPDAKDPLLPDDAVSPPQGSDLEPIDLPAQLLADAQTAIEALGDPTELLYQATICEEVVGEWLLVGYVDQLGAERWEARATDSVVQTEDGWLLRGKPGKGTTGGKERTTQEGGNLLDPDTSYLARVWRPDSQWPDLSDSPMAGVLDVCETVLLLGRKVRANTRSRLAAGILVVPSEIEEQPGLDPVTGQYVEARPYDELLTEVMSLAISDETSTASVVPIVTKVPGEASQHMRRIDLGRASDPEDRAERQEHLDRVMQGLDFPPEIVTGFADVKYANARAITEGSFRDHIEPKVLRKTSSLTTAYLWPRLRVLGWSAEQIAPLCVWHDPSDLVTNPDQGLDAQTVFDAGELSGAALRRYRGFTESDAPADDERARYLLLKGRVGASGAPAVEAPAGQPANPEPQEPAAARGIRAAARLAALTRTPMPALTAAAAPLSALGDRLARIDVHAFGVLQGAADAAMRRALERASSRARSKARDAERATVAGTPTDQLVSVLGRQRLEELGLTVDQLLDGDPFGALCARFEATATNSFERALEELCKATGQPYDSAGALTADASDPFADLTPLERTIAARLLEARGIDLDGARAQFLTDRQLAVDGLRARLTSIAADRLFDPDAREPHADPDSTVPPGVLRAALARAGGSQSAPGSAGVDDDGRPLLDTDPPAGGVASGWSIREQSARAGLVQHAYRWEHGVTGNPFEPHLALDGQVFADQTDPRLRKDPSSWPRGTTSYHVGDHVGCGCQTAWLYDDPFAGLSASAARSVRARQAARDSSGRFIRTPPRLPAVQ